MFPLLPIVGFTAIALLGYAAGAKGNTPRPRRKTRAVRRIGGFLVSTPRTLQEQPVVLASEEIPLDNTFGNRLLVSEHEFSRTATVTVELDRTQALSSLTHAGTSAALRAEMRARLTDTLELEIGAQLIRRVRLRFSVGPGDKGLYRLTWVQTASHGVFDVNGNGRKMEIPYLITYGLSHQVATIAIQRNANKTTTN